MISSRDILAHQLSSVIEVARRQSRVLQQLDIHYPGAIRLETDNAGRLVI